jgi:transcriptional regulator with XRE-family HTH domain
VSRQLQLRHIVGKRIAQKRREAKLLQRIVAEQLHLTTEGYARYERGLSSPDVEFLGKLAKILGCSVAELVTETSTALNAQAQHIAKLMDGLGSSDRDEVVKIVEGVCAIAHKKYKKVPPK